MLVFGSLTYVFIESETDYKQSLSELKISGELVDITILGDIKAISVSKKRPYNTYTEISYTDVVTNRVVRRYVKRCERIAERLTIGCMVKDEVPLKMLYVPSYYKMWASCRRFENDNDLWVCSTSNSTHQNHPPFTFEIEQFENSL